MAHLEPHTIAVVAVVAVVVAVVSFTTQGLL
jgi:hypothetical protein